MAEPFHLVDVQVIPDELTVIRDGQNVTLEPRAMELLMVLAGEPGKVLSRNQLMDQVWGQAEVSDQALTNAIWELRQALGDSSHDSQFIRTIPRRGYRLIPEPILIGPVDAPVELQAALPVDPKGHKRRLWLWLTPALVVLISALTVWWFVRGPDQFIAPETSLYGAWQFNTGGELHTDPLVLDEQLLFGSHDGFVYALSLLGDERWRADTGVRVELQPTSDGQSVFVTASDGHIYAFALETGEELWRRNVNAISPPVVMGEGLYVTSYERDLWRLDLATGEAELVLEAVGEIRVAPAVYGNLMLFATEEGLVSAVDVPEQRLVWRVQLQGDIFDAPTLHEQALFIGTDAGYVYALNVLDGSENWRSRIAARGAGAVDVDPQRGQLTVGTNGGDLVTLDVEHGEERWRVKQDNFFSTPRSAHGVVLSGNGDGALYAVAAEDGRLLWQAQMGAWLTTRPAVASGMALIGDVAGKLHAIPLSGHQAPKLDQADEPGIAHREPLWTTELGDPMTIAPGVHGEVLLVPAGAALHAVSLQSGEPLWRYPLVGDFDSTPVVGGGRAWVTTRSARLVGVPLDEGRAAIEIPLPLGSVSSPAWTGDGLILGDFAGSIHHYAVDGSMRWSLHTAITANADPLLMGGIAVMGSCDGWVYGLDVDSGQIHWRADAGDCVVADTVSADGRYFTGTADGEFLAFDGNGERLWGFRTGGEIWYQAATGDGLVVFGSGDYHLYALDQVTGEERWRFRTGNRALSDVVYHDGLFYAGSYDGCLYALGATTGEPQWRYCAQRELINPVLAGKQLVIGGEDGILYAFAL